MSTSVALCFHCCSTCFILVRVDPHHHHGLASEGDPGILHLPRGQPARVAFPDSVHPGRGDHFIYVSVKAFVQSV